MTVIKHHKIDLSEDEYIYLKKIKGDKDWKTFIMEIARGTSPILYYTNELTEAHTLIKTYIDDPYYRLLLDKIMRLYTLVLHKKMEEAIVVLKDIASDIGLEVVDRNEQNVEKEVIK